MSHDVPNLSRIVHLVHLRPVPGYFIPGVAAIEQYVTPEIAAVLLAYTPAAFTADPITSAVLRHRREDIFRPPKPPPESPAIKPPEIPVDKTGITDSRE